LNWGTTLGLATLFIVAAVVAPLAKPVRAEGPGIDLERIVPAAFGDWHIDSSIEAIPPSPDVKAKLDRIYKETITRTYVNGAGEHMMLTIAYGGDQSDALKAHRQEACYRAQGFTVANLHTDALSLEGRRIPVTRMVATRGERIEPVTYWLTMADRVVLGRAERLQSQIAAGFKGRIPDGMLVRVSSLSGDAAAAFAAQQAFAAALFSAVPQSQTQRFIGAAQS
jgi:EpsI family protein